MIIQEDFCGICESFRDKLNNFFGRVINNTLFYTTTLSRSVDLFFRFTPVIF